MILRIRDGRCDHPRFAARTWAMLGLARADERTCYRSRLDPIVLLSESVLFAALRSVDWSGVATQKGQ